jgi:hypothetical protein
VKTGVKRKPVANPKMYLDLEQQKEVWENDDQGLSFEEWKKQNKSIYIYEKEPPFYYGDEIIDTDGHRAKVIGFSRKHEAGDLYLVEYEDGERHELFEKQLQKKKASAKKYNR